MSDADRVLTPDEQRAKYLRAKAAYDAALAAWKYDGELGPPPPRPIPPHVPGPVA